MYYYLLHDQKDLIQIYFKENLIGKSFDLFYDGLKPIKKILSSNIYLLDDEQYEDFLIFDVMDDFSFLDLKQYYKLYKNISNYHITEDLPRIQLLALNIDAKKDDHSLKDCENFLYTSRGKEILLLETDLSKNIEIVKFKIANKETLEDKDLFSLIFYPLTFEDDKDVKINEVIDIIKNVNDSNRTFVMAGLMLICKTFYKDETFNRIVNYLHKDEEFLEFRDEYYKQIAFDEDEYDDEPLQKLICYQFRTPYDITKYIKPKYKDLEE